MIMNGEVCMIKKLARYTAIIAMVSICLSGITNPFFADVNVKADELGTFENLGPQITSVTTHAGAFL